MQQAQEFPIRNAPASAQAIAIATTLYILKRVLGELLESRSLTSLFTLLLITRLIHFYNPGNIVTYTQRGLRFLSNRDTSLALRARINPAIYKDLGLRLLEQERFIDAWDVFTKVPSDEVDNHKALFQLLFSLLTQEKTTNIITLIDKKLNQTAQAYYEAGTRYKKTGDHKTAYMYFKTAIDKNVAKFQSGFLKRETSVARSGQELRGKAQYNAGFSLFQLVLSASPVTEVEYNYLLLAESHLNQALHHPQVKGPTERALRLIQLRKEELSPQFAPIDAAASPQPGDLLNSLRLGEDFFGPDSAGPMQEMLRKGLQDDPEQIRGMIETLGMDPANIEKAMADLSSALNPGAGREAKKL